MNPLTRDNEEIALLPFLLNLGIVSIGVLRDDFAPDWIPHRHTTKVSKHDGAPSESLRS